MTNYRNMTVWGAYGKQGTLLCTYQGGSIIDAWNAFEGYGAATVRPMIALTGFCRRKNISILQIKNDVRRCLNADLETE